MGTRHLSPNDAQRGRGSPRLDGRARIASGQAPAPGQSSSCHAPAPQSAMLSLEIWPTSAPGMPTRSTGGNHVGAF